MRSYIGMSHLEFLTRSWIRNRSGRYASRIAALSAFLVFVAACGSSPPSETPSATPEGSRPSVAPTKAGGLVIERTQIPTSAPSAVPSCRASDLTATFMGGQGLTGGSVQDWIALTNSSDATCSLQGTPDLTLLDPNGNAVPVASWRRSPCQGAVPCPYFPVARLDPGAKLLPHQASPGAAAFSLIWTDHDIASGKCEPPPPEVTGIRVALPSGGGTVDVGKLAETPVRLKPCGTWVSVGWLIASGEFEHYLDYRLDARIQEPQAVPAGQELSYRVALGPSPVGGLLPEFDPCPSGTAFVSPGAPLGEPKVILARHEFTIDCRSVSESIGAYGGTAILGKINIPADSQPGTYTLTWFLDPESEARVSAQVAFEVKSQ